MCIDHKKGVNPVNLFRQLDRVSPQIRMSRRQHVAVAGNVSNTHIVDILLVSSIGDVRANTRHDGFCSAVRVAVCRFSFFAHR